MPEIPIVRFSCGNSNIGPTTTTRHDRMSPNYAEKRKKHVQNRLKNTRCKGVHAIERPDSMFLYVPIWLMVKSLCIACVYFTTGQRVGEILK
jgi:hypothetical protein